MENHSVKGIDNKACCSGCTACVHICSYNAITMIMDKEGFQYALVDNNKCKKCGACVKVCPFKPCDENSIPGNQRVFQIRNRDMKVVEKSSSGGVFTAISDYVIENGGVVYGAVFDEVFNVKHERAINKQQRDKMCGSKYIESRLNTEIFTNIKKDLDNKNIVLFTGTACQNAGLKSYLKNLNYDNLITCDFLCAGVESPILWQDWLNYLKYKYNENILEINFRKKSKGWRNFYTEIKFEKSIYEKSRSLDKFAIIDSKGFIHRPSCDNCVYSKYKRYSDITLGDFWNIKYVDRELNDDKGISIFITNTKKGEKYIELIKEKVQIEEKAFESCLNPRLIFQRKENVNRNIFWLDYFKYGFGFILTKYGKVNIKNYLITDIIRAFLIKTGIFTWIFKNIIK